MTSSPFFFANKFYVQEAQLCLGCLEQVLLHRARDASLGTIPNLPGAVRSGSQSTRICRAESTSDIFGSHGSEVVVSGGHVFECVERNCSRKIRSHFKLVALCLRVFSDFFPKTCLRPVPRNSSPQLPPEIQQNRTPRI